MLIQSVALQTNQIPMGNTQQHQRLNAFSNFQSDELFSAPNLLYSFYDHCNFYELFTSTSIRLLPLPSEDEWLAVAARSGKSRMPLCFDTVEHCRHIAFRQSLA
jgi:hypothetical protein